MPEPKKHGTKSKQGMRRSQKKLKPINILPCPSCNAPLISHRVCKNCGAYGTVVKATQTIEQNKKRTE